MATENLPEGNPLTHLFPDRRPDDVEDEEAEPLSHLMQPREPFFERDGKRFRIVDGVEQVPFEQLYHSGLHKPCYQGPGMHKRVTLARLARDFAPYIGHWSDTEYLETYHETWPDELLKMAELAFPDGAATPCEFLQWAKSERCPLDPDAERMLESASRGQSPEGPSSESAEGGSAEGDRPAEDRVETEDGDKASGTAEGDGQGVDGEADAKDVPQAADKASPRNGKGKRTGTHSAAPKKAGATPDKDHWQAKKRAEKLRKLESCVKRIIEDNPEECRNAKSDLTAEATCTAMRFSDNPDHWPQGFPKPTYVDRWVKDIRDILKRLEYR